MTHRAADGLQYFRPVVGLSTKLSVNETQLKLCLVHINVDAVTNLESLNDFFPCLHVR